MTNSESKGTGSPSHHHKETKKTLLKDLSKRILRRVNSGNFSHSHRQRQQEHKKSLAQLKPLVPGGSGSNSKSRKGSTSALQQHQTNEISENMLPVKDTSTHRCSISSIGPPMIELSEHGHVIGGPKDRVERQTRSNTNSIDRNSHFRENYSGNDSCSFTTNNPYNIGIKGNNYIRDQKLDT